MFPPLDILIWLNIGLNMLHSSSFMSCLDILPRYAAGGFHALQMIVLDVLGAVD